MPHPIQIIVLSGCDNCGQELRPDMMICDACLERSRKREIAPRPVTLCPQCGSPMEFQASEDNNSGSDAEWYQCQVCDYETEVD